MASLLDNPMAPYLQARGLVNSENAQRQQQFIGLMGIQAQLEEREQKRQLMPLQLQKLQQEIARQSQLQGLLSQFANRAQGGNVAAQGALAQGAEVGDVGPTVTNAARIPQSRGLGYGPSDLVPLKLAGHDTTDLLKIWEAMNPPAQIHGGYSFNPRQLSHGQPVPSMHVTPEGRGVQTTIGPGGPSMSAVPGAINVFTQFQQAQENVKAGMDPFLGELDPVGKPIPQTRLGFAERYRPAPSPTQASPPNPLMRVTPEVQAQRDAEARRLIVAEGQPNGGGLIPSDRVLTQPRGMGMSSAEKVAADATASGRAKSGVEYEEDVLKAGRAARGNLTSLQVLAPNLESMPTGPLYPMMVGGAGYFKQFGIDVGELGKQVGPAQATGAILNQLALKLRNPAGGEGMPGALSDQDRNFLMRAIPGLDKVPDGNKLLIGMLMALEQRKIDEAGIVNAMQRDGKSSNDIRDALRQFADSRHITQAFRR